MRGIRMMRGTSVIFGLFFMVLGISPVAHALETSTTTSLEYTPGKGITVESGDGNFRLRTGLRAQFLYSLEHDEPLIDDESGYSQGFQIRRARVKFTGHLFGKNNRFKTELAISPRDIGLDDSGVPHRSMLLDSYMDFTHWRDLNIRIGQYKIPYSRQRVISSANMHFVDRALANGEFNLDRDIGLDIRSKAFLGQEWLRYYAGVYIGEGHSAFAMGDMGMMYLGRLELLPFGTFDDMIESDLNRNKHARLSLGVAYAYLADAKGMRGIRGSEPEDGGTTDYHNVTVDGIFKWRGISAQGEFFWRQGERDPGTRTRQDGTLIDPEAPSNGFGYFAQLGSMLGRLPVEIAGRFSQTRALGEASSLRPQNELGGAVNYYMAGHAFKVQADYHKTWESGTETFAGGIDTVRMQLQATF